MYHPDVNPKTGNLNIHPRVLSFCMAQGSKIMFSSLNPDDVNATFEVTGIKKNVFPHNSFSNDTNPNSKSYLSLSCKSIISSTLNSFPSEKHTILFLLSLL